MLNKQKADGKIKRDTKSNAFPTSLYDLCRLGDTTGFLG